MKQSRSWLDALGWASKRCPIGRWDHPPYPVLALSDLTIVVSTFLRFDCLRRFLTSARFYYPGLPIIVADQSGERAQGEDFEFCRHFPNTTWIATPFDAGISASRNRAVESVQTAGVLLLDDDHLFTEESRLDRLLDVFNANRSLGLVCGVLRMDNGVGNSGRTAAGWFADLKLQNGILEHSRPSRPWQKTPGGTHWRPIDRFINCFVAPTQLLKDFPWYERHKIAGEHLDHVLTLWHAKVPVAYTPNCIFGERHDNSPEYMRFRRRNTGRLAETRWKIRQQTGLQTMEREHGIADELSTPPSPRQPNIVLLTVGHTGSSIVTGLFAALGWNLAPDNDPVFNESLGLRRASDQHLATGEPIDAAGLLRSLPEPWIIKDPRFCETLQSWIGGLSEYRPMLLWLDRDSEAVRASWERRGEDLTFLATRQAAAARHFYYWPWSKRRIRLEDVACWVGGFDPVRAISPPLPTGS